MFSSEEAQGGLKNPGLEIITQGFAIVNGANALKRECADGAIDRAHAAIGQGEREQTYLPQLGRALSGGGGNEHLELGARSLLIRQSAARYFIFDAKRAVDYLVSRADVDAHRLGVTGCSGGGAITPVVVTPEARSASRRPVGMILTL